MRDRDATKQRLLKELYEYFGADSKRIDHAKQVMNFAEELLRFEKADWIIVVPASILHDVGIKVAEEKYGSTADYYQEKEGPAVAERILSRSGFRREEIDEICTIIANHHSPGKVNTVNFKVLYDADCLVNLKDKADNMDKARLQETVNNMFLTEAGMRLAEKIYLNMP